MRSVVQLYPGPPSYRLLVARRWSLAFANDERPKTNDRVGAVAQLGERLVCNQEATGSIPVSSTRKTVVGRWPVVFGQRWIANDQGRTTNDQFNVGRQCDNRFRITVQESRLAPNIGLEKSCQPSAVRFQQNSNPLRRVGDSSKVQSLQLIAEG